LLNSAPGGKTLLQAAVSGYDSSMRRAFFPFQAAFLLAVLIPLSAGENPLDDPLRLRAVQLAKGLDDRALAAQVLLTGIDGKGSLEDGMKALLRRVPAGGIMLFRYNLSVEKPEIAPFLEDAAAAVRAGSGITPFIAVDHEGGSVHRFGEGVARLPAPLAYWEKTRAAEEESAGGTARQEALARVEEDAFRSGEEIRSLGITLNLAPVAEVLTDGNKAFLDNRSYGPDAAFVEAACAAFIRGMEKAGILCAVKHFPGNTGEDPHKGQSVLAGDRGELNRVAAPMIRLLKIPHPPVVMVSHALAPAWDRERSASLSPEVIGSWLRGEIGFSGVVLADDFMMGAVSSARDPRAAAIEALNAGVDLLMAWPSGLAAVHAAILAALREGRLPRARLEEAAARIIYEKLRLGITPP
jgi:beta-N-acetylhexosaminidase